MYIYIYIYIMYLLVYTNIQLYVHVPIIRVVACACASSARSACPGLAGKPRRLASEVTSGQALASPSEFALAPLDEVRRQRETARTKHPCTRPFVRPESLMGPRLWHDWVARSLALLRSLWNSPRAR